MYSPERGCRRTPGHVGSTDDCVSCLAEVDAVRADTTRGRPQIPEERHACGGVRGRHSVAGIILASGGNTPGQGSMLLSSTDGF